MFNHEHSNARACYQPKQAWDLNKSKPVKFSIRNRANHGSVTPFFIISQRLPYGYTVANAKVAIYLNEAAILKVAAFKWEGSEEWTPVHEEHFYGSVPSEVSHDGRKFVWEEGLLKTLVKIHDGYVPIGDDEEIEFEEFIQGYCPQAYAWAVSLD